MPVMPYAEACCAAISYVHWLGLSVLPIGENKKPPIKWKGLQEQHPTFEEILSWPKDGFNLAVITGRISGGLVIVDCDSGDDAKWFWKEKGQSPVVVKTKRGFHFYFQSACEVRNAHKCFGKHDVRGEGGYALIPPSRHSEGQYEWHRGKKLASVAQLPAFHPSWRPESDGYSFDDRKITDGAAYIACIEAVEGSGGDKDTYRAAMALRDSGLSESEALYVLLEWNRTNAKPPWGAKELLHKVCCAFKENRP
jgi:hypothetical protein